MNKTYEITTSDKVLQRKLEMAKLKSEFTKIEIRRFPSEFMNVEDLKFEDACRLRNAWNLKSVSDGQLSIFSEALNKAKESL